MAHANKKNDACQTDEEIISLFGTQDIASIQPHLCPPIAPFPTDSTASVQVATAIDFAVSGHLETQAFYNHDRSYFENLSAEERESGVAGETYSYGEIFRVIDKLRGKYSDDAEIFTDTYKTKLFEIGERFSSWRWGYREGCEGLKGQDCDNPSSSEVKDLCKTCEGETMDEQIKQAQYAYSYCTNVLLEDNVYDKENWVKNRPGYIDNVMNNKFCYDNICNGLKAFSEEITAAVEEIKSAFNQGLKRGDISAVVKTDQYQFLADKLVYYTHHPIKEVTCTVTEKSKSWSDESTWNDRTNEVEVEVFSYELCSSDFDSCIVDAGKLISDDIAKDIATKFIWADRPSDNLKVETVTCNKSEASVGGLWWGGSNNPEEIPLFADEELQQKFRTFSTARPKLPKCSIK